MGAIAAIIGAGCCCDGTPCGVCNDPPTTFLVESTLEFDWGYPEDCEGCCEGMVHPSFSADIGSLLVGYGGAGAKTTDDFPGGTWATPDYPEQTQISECNAEISLAPCVPTGPWFRVQIGCATISGVAYGEVRITLWRNTFALGGQLGTIKYRKQVEGPDCEFPLGVYEYAEHDFDWEDCNSPDTALEVIRNVDFGTVTMS